MVVLVLIRIHWVDYVAINLIRYVDLRMINVYLDHSYIHMDIYNVFSDIFYYDYYDFVPF